MLQEIRSVRQADQQPLRKRWFCSRQMDLFVWFDRETPQRFQLSYDKLCDEHMICWDQQQGLQHYRVDDGEHTGQYKMSPLIQGSSALPDQAGLMRLARSFLAAGEQLEASLADFIFARLLEMPAATARAHDNANHKDPAAQSAEETG